MAVESCARAGECWRQRFAGDGEFGVVRLAVVAAFGMGRQL
jgi:hypothetical protein